MSNRRIGIAIALLFLSSGAYGTVGASPAAPPGARPGMHEGVQPEVTERGKRRSTRRFFHWSAEIAEKLGLSEEQVQAIQAIRIEAAKQRIDSRAQIRKNRLHIRSLLRESGPDREAIGQLIVENEELRKSIRLSRREAIERSREVLTPDQLDALEELRQQRRQSRPNR